VIRKFYNAFVRENLPRKRKVLNGVVTRKARLLDLTTVNDGYEEPLVRAVREFVRPTDTCLIIGGGWGVSTVVAARITDNVIVYEGSVDQVEHVEETLTLNDVSDRVDLRLGLVAGSGEFYGETPAESVPPDRLPDADVLVMDCEGAELDVLQGMTIRPQTVVVESHGHFGAPTDAVTDILTNRGYEIRRTEPESEETDVMIVTATYG
jgi:hypothetical protein